MLEDNRSRDEEVCHKQGKRGRGRGREKGTGVPIRPPIFKRLRVKSHRWGEGKG